MSQDEAAECPLCMEPLELDDLSFYPCTCGYQICRFCWHRLRTDENGLCPACRKQYSEDPANFKPLSVDEMQQKAKNERKAKKQKLVENRKHLSNVRVVQKNLVFVVGLPPRLACQEQLKSHECFGKFGKVYKVVVNQTTSYAGVQGPSASAYVTYYKSEDALRAIEAVNNVRVDGKMLKASLGTTKYCNHFLKGSQCPKSDCMYLHDLGNEEASFTKEQMQAGKHTEYERTLHEELAKASGGGGGGQYASGNQRASTKDGQQQQQKYSQKENTCTNNKMSGQRSSPIPDRLSGSQQAETPGAGPPWNGHKKASRSKGGGGGDGNSSGSHRTRHKSSECSSEEASSCEDHHLNQKSSTTPTSERSESSDLDRLGGADESADEDEEVNDLHQGRHQGHQRRHQHHRHRDSDDEEEEEADDAEEDQDDDLQERRRRNDLDEDRDEDEHEKRTEEEDEDRGDEDYEDEGRLRKAVHVHDDADEEDSRTSSSSAATGSDRLQSRRARPPNDREKNRPYRQEPGETQQQQQTGRQHLQRQQRQQPAASRGAKSNRRPKNEPEDDAEDDDEEEEEERQDSRTPSPSSRSRNDSDRCSSDGQYQQVDSDRPDSRDNLCRPQGGQAMAHHEAVGPLEDGGRGKTPPLRHSLNQLSLGRQLYPNMPVQEQQHVMMHQQHQQQLQQQHGNQQAFDLHQQHHQMFQYAQQQQQQQQQQLHHLQRSSSRDQLQMAGGGQPNSLVNDIELDFDPIYISRKGLADLIEREQHHPLAGHHPPVSLPHPMPSTGPNHGNGANPLANLLAFGRMPPSRPSPPGIAPLPAGHLQAGAHHLGGQVPSPGFPPGLANPLGPMSGMGGPPNSLGAQMPPGHHSPAPHQPMRRAPPPGFGPPMPHPPQHGSGPYNPFGQGPPAPSMASAPHFFGGDMINPGANNFSYRNYAGNPTAAGHCDDLLNVKEQQEQLRQLLPSVNISFGPPPNPPPASSCSSAMPGNSAAGSSPRAPPPGLMGGLGPGGQRQQMASMNVLGHHSGVHHGPLHHAGGGVQHGPGGWPETFQDPAILSSTRHIAQPTATTTGPADQRPSPFF